MLNKSYLSYLVLGPIFFCSITTFAQIDCENSEADASVCGFHFYFAFITYIFSFICWSFFPVCYAMFQVLIAFFLPHKSFCIPRIFFAVFCRIFYCNSVCFFCALVRGLSIFSSLFSRHFAFSSHVDNHRFEYFRNQF